MKAIETGSADGTLAGWFGFACLWFCAAVVGIVVVMRTSVAADARGSDFFFCWLLLAGGTLVSAAGFSATWALVHMDVRWLRLPRRKPARHGPRPAKRRRAGPATEKVAQA